VPFKAASLMETKKETPILSLLVAFVEAHVEVESGEK
jgi:hypothetical protein